MMTKQLHSTSLGRIYMMLRADIVTHKMTLLALYGGLILLFFAVPRIPLLFGEDYQEWLVDYASTYHYIVAYSVISITSLMYFYIYVNRRTMQSSPTLYATVPAEWWEKLVSMLLYGFLLYILGHTASLLSYLIEVLSNTHLDTHQHSEMWLGFEVYADLPVNEHSLYLSVLSYVIWVSVVYLLGLVPFYIAMLMRNGLVALFVYALTNAIGLVLIFIFVYFTGLVMGAYGVTYLNGELMNPNVYPFTTTIALLLLVLSLGATFLTIRRLRTIPA